MTQRAETLVTKRAETIVLASGQCRICGCTDDRACSFPSADGPYDLEANFSIDEVANAPATLGCWWVDAARTLCSNPHCIAQVPIDELLEIGYLEPETQVKAAGR